MQDYKWTKKRQNFYKDSNKEKISGKKIELEQEELRQQQKEQAQMLERKRQHVLDEAKREEEVRKQELLEKHQLINLAIEKSLQENAKKLKFKKEKSCIVQQLKGDNIQRIKRMYEYKRLETLKKVQHNQHRTEKLIKLKQNLMQQRKDITIQSKIQRDIIMKTMEKVKVTKKWTLAAETVGVTHPKTSASSSSSILPFKSLATVTGNDSTTAATITCTNPHVIVSSTSHDRLPMNRSESLPALCSSSLLTTDNSFTTCPSLTDTTDCPSHFFCPTLKGFKLAKTFQQVIPQSFISPYETLAQEIVKNKNKNNKNIVH